MRAAVLTAFGGPDMLGWADVDDPEPGPGEIRIQVRGAGVGPTDLHLRSGQLAGVFGITPPVVLGFEAAGTVDALGAGTTGVAVGDDVAVLLPALGGYAERAVASVWVRKPASVAWDAAAALPASAEAAVGVLRQLGARDGEHLVVLGAGGSVGLIAVQLALAAGLRVSAVAGDHDQELLTSLGATFVAKGASLEASLSSAGRVDAVLDAAGAGGLDAAVRLAGGPERVVTLVDPTAAALGVRLSQPGPDRAPDALDVTMPMLASGALRLKPRTTVPLAEASRAHALLESSGQHPKIVLTA
ncbi:alcohol dehydrogenase catalytic domain-containing protein [Microlunatus spumicola]